MQTTFFTKHIILNSNKVKHLWGIEPLELAILTQVTFKHKDKNPWHCTLKREQKMPTPWKESVVAHKITIQFCSNTYLPL
jgi:hypothetical protein